MIFIQVQIVDHGVWWWCTCKKQIIQMSLCERSMHMLSFSLSFQWNFLLLNKRRDGINLLGRYYICSDKSSIHFCLKERWIKGRHYRLSKYRKKNSLTYKKTIYVHFQFTLLKKNIFWYIQQSWRFRYASIGHISPFVIGNLSVPCK